MAKQQNHVEITRELLRESKYEVLKKIYVDQQSIVTPEEFKKIANTDPSNNHKYTAWILNQYKKLLGIGRKEAGRKPSEIEKKLFWEDLYKLEGYIDLFHRLKHKFPKKDINHYNLEEFKKDVLDMKEKYKDDPSVLGKGKSKYDDKYAEYKIGEAEGFDIYEIPKGATNLKTVSCELGSGTEWCTAHSGASHFESYIKDGPLFIIINQKDPSEKYQFHFESGQFMDKNDRSIF